ncbi:hypothetical protein CEXT_596981 [Caerostris extrusa]|uniref:Uncharacterized protein n=1 Tax=Caerostris extrusa TaxID=172846 RepID=A0AAV4UI00_CAEEX|nr:hypothetical protein CEXT_596981 [Caerostris extrusa]
MQMNARAISCRRTFKKDIGRETTTKNVHTLQLPLTFARMDWHPHHHITEDMPEACLKNSRHKKNNGHNNFISVANTYIAVILTDSNR